MKTGFGLSLVWFGRNLALRFDMITEIVKIAMNSYLYLHYLFFTLCMQQPCPRAKTAIDSPREVTLYMWHKCIVNVQVYLVVE